MQFNIPKEEKMKTLKVLITMLFSTIVLMAAMGNDDTKMKLVKKEYKNIKSLEIDLTSGDCEIIASNSKKVTVKVKYDVKPKGCFEPEFYQQGTNLKLSEDWKGGSCRGKVLWIITVPKNTETEFESASGDFSAKGMVADLELESASGDIFLADCEGDIEIDVASGDIEASNLEGDIEISTASGDIDITDSKGELELTTASGDIEAENLSGNLEFSVASGDMDVENCKGEFDLSTASGDIDASELVLEGTGDFSVASGDVNIVLGSTPKYDITVSAASGDATLDFNGNKILGTIIMRADKRRGEINAPFSADKTEEIEIRNRTYLEKTYDMGDNPKIFIKTASGEAILKK